MDFKSNLKRPAEDNRPFWIRAPEQNLRQGYTLHVDAAHEEAWWSHPWKAGLSQEWRRVPDILEAYAAEYPDQFKYVKRKPVEIMAEAEAEAKLGP